MEDREFDAKSDGPAMSRRVFFGRTFAVAGGTVGLLSLTACPGGDDGDDDDDDGDDD
ncbi:hypothetical protein Ais01nite_64320 [Asanoa ishikariensis]|uniref:Uncharacterized protein n=1 Tax=Asanoa ishikariensis TaxID=137265 RepID=A0A1H3NUG1_9ACTN|nr:hypothetical protein [Asanoa ishikariensis]GIF68397.1 hypothetical protein Ais01nite_64320 [Asanoa ishikariensis]SDY91769.1 hypothetical protein SAMN05421684_2291 [Asanoa ishikariensis]